MSARVLHPAMMSEVSAKLGAIVGPPTVVGRVAPSRAALARVRRDLFGPVDHAAARAYAERELRAQAALDCERWGFDFRLERPETSEGSRFEWELITTKDVVPEPYALRGMPYLRRQSPATPRKSPRSPRLHRAEDSPIGAATRASVLLEATCTAVTPNKHAPLSPMSTERTPPQESRVPIIGEKTPDVVPAIAELSFRTVERSSSSSDELTSTPVPSSQTRKQAAITDFMKSRKRALNGSTKSVVEPPEKVSRNAGQIRS